MRLKKLVSSILIGTMIILSSQSVVSAATGDIKVLVNGTSVEFDTKPIANSSGRIMVPVSSIAKMLDAVVNWDGQKQQVTITKGETKLVLTIGSKVIEINGENEQMDSSASMIGGRTMVPLSIIAKSFNADVKWDGTTRTVTITTKGAGNSTTSNGNSTTNTSSGNGGNTTPKVGVAPTIKTLELTEIGTESIKYTYTLSEECTEYLVVANDEYAEKVSKLSAVEFKEYVEKNEGLWNEVFIFKSEYYTSRSGSLNYFFGPGDKYKIFLLVEDKDGNLSTISSKEFTMKQKPIYFNPNLYYVGRTETVATVVIDDYNTMGFDIYCYIQEKPISDTESNSDTESSADIITADFVLANGTKKVLKYPNNQGIIQFEVEPDKEYEVYAVIKKGDVVSGLVTNTIRSEVDTIAPTVTTFEFINQSGQDTSKCISYNYSLSEMASSYAIIANNENAKTLSSYSPSQIKEYALTHTGNNASITVNNVLGASHGAGYSGDYFTPNTNYTIFVVAEDFAGHLSEVNVQSFKTTASKN